MASNQGPDRSEESSWQFLKRCHEANQERSLHNRRELEDEAEVFIRCMRETYKDSSLHFVKDLFENYMWRTGQKVYKAMFEKYIECDFFDAVLHLLIWLNRFEGDHNTLLEAHLSCLHAVAEIAQWLDESRSDPFFSVTHPFIQFLVKTELVNAPQIVFAACHTLNLLFNPDYLFSFSDSTSSNLEFALRIQRHLLFASSTMEVHEKTSFEHALNTFLRIPGFLFRCVDSPFGVARALEMVLRTEPQSLGGAARLNIQIIEYSHIVNKALANIKQLCYTTFHVLPRLKFWLLNKLIQNGLMRLFDLLLQIVTNFNEGNGFESTGNFLHNLVSLIRIFVNEEGVLWYILFSSSQLQKMMEVNIANRDRFFPSIQNNVQQALHNHIHVANTDPKSISLFISTEAAPRTVNVFPLPTQRGIFDQVTKLGVDMKRCPEIHLLQFDIMAKAMGRWPECMILEVRVSFIS